MAFGKKTEEVATIRPANLVQTVIRIRGTAPYVQNKFSEKVREELEKKFASSEAENKSSRKRAPKDFDKQFEEAQHISTGGWNGIPCPAFRAAMIDACRTVGIQMTRAKMSVFVLPDGFDKDDGTPLVKILGKKPEQIRSSTINADGSPNICARPMWREWEAEVTLEFDADMITAESVVNLLDRAGRQVGVGCGRPFSKNSCGQGWGTFAVVTKAEKKKVK